jgi:hypothetical protein
LNLTRKLRWGSPTCSRSSTCAPLLLLQHACGPSPPAITGLSHKFFSFKYTFHNNHINNQYRSFFQSLISLYFMFFLLHPLISSFFIQPYLSFISLYLNCYYLNLGLLLSNRYCLDLGLLLSNRYCLELLLSRPWTVTVQVLLSRPWTVIV